jgi:NAD(P)H-dependent FMN reductase
MQALRLLIISGSSRPGSYNGRLASVAGTLASEAGATVTRLDLRSLGLPIYDAEIEAAGLPEGATGLRDTVASHDAVIVTSPEYNGFPTPLLINAFDWVSRTPAAGDKPAGLAALAGKPICVMSASPGPFGGMRSLMFARQFFHNVLGMLVVPEQLAISQAMNAFDETGLLRDEKQLQGVRRVVNAVIRVGRALHLPAA